MNVQLRHVEDEGGKRTSGKAGEHQHAYRLETLDGGNLRQGLFINVQAAVARCLDKGWEITRLVDEDDREIPLSRGHMKVYRALAGVE
jgi:hypothetical protein